MGSKASAQAQDHQRGEASADGANTLPAAKHLHERGPNYEYGYDKHQLDIPSEEQHEA
jgi:hypothetical protein